MKKIITGSLCLASLFFAYSAQAKNMDFPDECPGITAILTSAGSMTVQYLEEEHGWVIYGNNSYNTPTTERWTFLAGLVKADDEAEARKKITAALSALTLTKGPIFAREQPYGECIYNGPNGFVAGAYWPPIMPGEMFKRLK